MAQLQDKRVWFVGGAVAATLIVAIGWFTFIGPEFSATDDLHAQEAATRQQNSELQLQVQTLQNKSKHLSTYTGSLRQALQNLPYDSGLPAFTRQISAQAAASHVVVSSLVVGGVTSLTAGAAAAPASAPASSAPASSAPASSAPASSATGATTGTTAATGLPAVAGGLYSIQVTIQSSGPLAQQVQFLKAIRVAGPRRALVTSAQLTPGAGAAEASVDGSASLTTQLTIFSAPQSPAQIAQLTRLLDGKIGN